MFFTHLKLQMKTINFGKYVSKKIIFDSFKNKNEKQSIILLQVHNYKCNIELLMHSYAPYMISINCIVNYTITHVLIINIYVYN